MIIGRTEKIILGYPTMIIECVGERNEIVANETTNQRTSDKHLIISLLVSTPPVLSLIKSDCLKPNPT